MRHTILFALMAVLTLAPLRAQNHATDTAAPAPYLCNTPLPYRPAKLDILMIGNSFSIDTAARLPSIFQSLGMRNVNVYVLYRGSCSMRQHYENLLTSQAAYTLYRYNYLGETVLEQKINLRDVMERYPYDIVVFQQYSLESGDYTTYEPYLSQVVRAYRLNTISPRTTFAFNETWAYASANPHIERYRTPLAMWRSICQSVAKMREQSGIDVIIPTGTAIQNARSIPSLRTDKELTRDLTHLDLNAGRYVAACTFFETLIAPCLCRSIRADFSLLGKSGDKTQVNNANRRLLQDCARAAVANNYSIAPELADPARKF